MLRNLFSFFLKCVKMEHAIRIHYELRISYNFILIEK